MLRYITISDLHAGALTSLLDDRPKPKSGLSLVPQAFGDALESFVEASGASPQLILLGDVLDLQFSKRQNATASAHAFLARLGQISALKREVIATAGNHDHALWTDARGGMDAAHFSPEGDGDYPQATPAFTPSPSAKSRLLTALVERAGFEDGVDFRYPNIGFSNDARAVFLHHGHFLEAEYRAMSHLEEALSGHKRDAISVGDLAAENAGWIDFAWSTFGDAAALGRDTERLYQNFLTSTGFRRLTGRWAEKAADALSQMLPLSGNLTLRETLGVLTRAGLDVTLGKFRDTERYAEVDALTPGGLEGLRWYIEGPALGQIRDEIGLDTTDRNKTVPDDLTFIFGHTHKPFSSHIAAEGFGAALKVYNSGGWTLNGPRLDNAEGAAMVLIDDDLNTVAVRLFQTPRNGEMRTAYVEVLSQGDGARRFAEEVDGWLKAGAAEWAALADSASAAYAARQRLLLALTEEAQSSLVMRAAE